MIGTIRKHQTWLWAFIIAAVVVSFVVYFTPTVQLGGGRGPVGNFGSIEGRPVPYDEYAPAYRETMLGYLFQYGQWPDRTGRTRAGFDLERETLNRILLLRKLEELDIHVGDEAVEHWIAHSPVFRRQGENGFSPDVYESFLNRVLPEGKLTPADFQRYVRHQVGIEQLLAVTGLSGTLVPPRQAEALYRQEHEQVEALAVFFLANNYLTNVTVDAESVAQFYTNRLSAYRVPEKVVMSFVRFELTNYLAEAETKLAADPTLTNRIEAEYLQRGASAFVDTNGQVLTATAAKEQIREEVRRAQALLLARKAAAEFATELLAMEPRRPENLENLAAAKGLLAQTSEPFSEFESPRDVKVTQPLGRLAFKLSEEEPFITGIVGADGVYVLALKQRIPSQVPDLASIRLRVENDFKRQKSLELARAAGQAFAAKLTNALAAGKTFEAFCAEENVPTVQLPPFSQRTYSLPGESRVSPTTLKDLANTLSVGQTSDFTETPQGGLVLHVVARRPVDEAQLQAELPEYLKTLRRQRQYEAFSEWLRKEQELAQVIPPGDGSQTP
jgi:peptidyl-prolyl cis-trans isomerase D